MFDKQPSESHGKLSNMDSCNIASMILAHVSHNGMVTLLVVHKLTAL